MKNDIKSMLLSEIEEYFTSINEPKYRAKQVFSWLHKNAVSTFDEMTNLSVSLREKLNNDFYITSPKLVTKQISNKDGTIKYLLNVDNVIKPNKENTIETVLMKYKHGNSVCISTQIGCKMGCIFCASCIGGFVRNLTASEMLDQIIFVEKDTNERVSNIVLMGIGEPLDNLDNVLRFVEIICFPDGMNKSARNITISTCGIVENIDKLSSFGVQLTLALSLHAPDDKTRLMLMPGNKSTKINDLLNAVDRYFEKTKRRITYEYIMIDGINDSVSQAKQLSNLLINRKSHLNLIQFNEIPESDFQPSKPDSIKDFTDELDKAGINYTIRRNLGSDIDASCGQLRRRNINTSELEYGVMGSN
ncbi:MAG: 23S rRNA (adenine(2503)-C(2))-methyltransferase RlmN [Oscillospiraceae bacterium]|jgi:23S rRNA (adenine2503-C2)-methyltransferase|nr:23S rRNA (adenine(2503)-C(2))-methyltransferase RlmN [Oscillospiraceae bacterium]